MKKYRKRAKNQKKNSDNKQLTEYISTMGISDMRSLLVGQNERVEVDESVVIEVLKRLSSQDEKTKKRFIESDDNDIKLKKAFETVITAASSKKMSVEAVELIEKFITMYKDLIEDYDTRNKQIYMYRLNKAIELAIRTIEQIASYINKMAVIDRG